MSEKPNASKVLDLYLAHVIREARDASEELLGSFLIQKGYRGKYIRVYILFVCKTERLNVENEIEIWLKIYKWIEDKKDELLRRYEIEDRSMIVLYPRFINFKEYRSLKRIDRAILDKNKIVWYNKFQSIR
jgi:hypothetical protein